MTGVFNRLGETLAQPGDACQPLVLRLSHKSRRAHAWKPFPILYRSMLAAHRSADVSVGAFECDQSQTDACRRFRGAICLRMFLRGERALRAISERRK